MAVRYEAPLDDPFFPALALRELKEAVFIADAETGVLLDANPFACCLLEQTREELRGRPHTDLHPPIIEAQSRAQFNQQATRDPSTPVHDLLVLPSGQTMPVEVVATKLSWCGRSILFAVFRDLRGREANREAHRSVVQEVDRHLMAMGRLVAHLAQPGKSFVEHVRVATECVQEACDVAHVCVWVLDPLVGRLEGVDRYANGKHSPPPSLNTQRYPAYVQALADHRCISAHEACRDPRTREFASDYLEPLGISSLLDTPIRQDGRVGGVISLEHVGPPRVWTAQEQAFVASVSDQLSLHLSKQRSHTLFEQLRRSEESLRSTMESIADAVITCDAQLAIDHLNPAAIQMLGVDLADARGRLVHEVIALNDLRSGAPIIDLVLRGDKGPEVPPAELIAATGRRLRVTVTSSPIRQLNGEESGVVFVLRDVTEHVLMEERLRQSQKMDAIGQLAGGIAHDFNNILGGIIGAAELLDHRLSVDDFSQKLLATIVTAARRGADLTTKLLSFSRRGGLVHEPTDLHAIVNETVGLLPSSTTVKINLQTDFCIEDAWVRGDAADLQSALLNLCINARDAMPDGGELRISTRIIDVTEAEVRSSEFSASAGVFVELCVSDTGSGMAEDVRQQIFDPFFSTKPVGGGTGLGLAAVYGMIVDHNGFLEVTSTLGRGSCFRLCIPRCAVRPGSGSYTDLPAIAAGGFGVLVIDDEELIRVSAGMTLEELGYQPFIAEDGRSGVQKLQDNPGEINLVLLDAVMPGLSGVETLALIRALAPEVPVLMTSGFSSERITLGGDGPDGFLRKPYSQAQLGQAISELLEPQAEV